MGMQRRPRLSLDLLKSFESAARHVSFTRAAEELFVTQSAVSRAVKTLEAQLGQPLFRRVNRGLELTDAGRMLQRVVGEALRRIEEAVDGLGSIESPRLTVTTNVPFASLWLAPRLPRFARLHPDVDLRLAASNKVMDLEREHVDLAIRWMPHGAAPERGDLVAVERVLPVCAPALLADPERPLATRADLARHVLLQFEPDGMRAPWLDWTQWFDEGGAGPAGSAGTVRFSHYDQVIQAAIDGSGVALGRLPLVTRQLRSGLLVAPLGSDAVADGGSFFLVAAEDARQRPEVRAFAEWVTDELRREAAGDGPAQ
jgi:DNA-binding transcriptional LysR family regulator